MADSLFDKRYRYDHIYPRGRSGETLRAVDEQDADRPVVIKRPAALDAPPIRAGQEVSIANERRALKQLSGHPVLTSLVGEGQFMVGGTAHQYIVMERASGMVVADAVLELNAIGERLPMLEILIIVDMLLDLLALAHGKGIVYNDVDAKHLFWDRDAYRLKVIDWGNAVFLEGDEMTPQGISRQTDIYQVGQLLYYLVTGGRRPDVPRDAGADFSADFGDDARRIHSRMQEIISRALHPSVRMRYPTIAALRADLTAFRQPLEKERNSAVASIAERLQRDDLSKNDLRALKTALETALQQDPGFPAARDAYNTIQDRLRDLAVEADLDAVRIYMEAGSWQRARDLLQQIQERAGSQTVSLISFLLDVCDTLLEKQTNGTPILQKALQHVFQAQLAQAVRTLMLEVPADDRQYRVQWLIAERISSHYPDVLLLRPNLYRLASSLEQLEAQGYPAPEPRQMLSSIEKTLETLSAANIDLPGLRDGYRSVVEQLTLVNPILQTFAFQHQFSSRQLTLNALDRALNAAMALTDAMHVIGRQATASPRDALNALDTSRAIDPTNPVWNDVEFLLKKLYERLQACQTYVPAADGSDLQGWLKTTQEELAPFTTRLFDDLLAKMVRDLDLAETVWEGYREAVIRGDRATALELIEDATSAVSTISPTLSAWFKHLHVVIEGATYIERHSIPNPIGRTLADGWEAFDRGRLSDAERLGQQAYENAQIPAEYEAARRLQDLGALTREWVERNGVNNPQRTQAILNEIDKRFSADEKGVIDNFTAQMPSVETYLKAMSRGLVEVFASSSTGALRLLYLRYVLLSALEVHENLMADGEFWREAAVRTLGDNGARHPAMRALDEFTQRKKDLNTAQQLFGRINGRHILPDLESIRRQLETNPQNKLLASGIQSLRDLELALRDWSDGDFRNAGLKLETVLKGINDLEKAAGFTLTTYRAWVMELLAAAAELLVQFRETRGILEQRPDDPDHRVYDCFHDMVRVTAQRLGDDYAGTLRTWRDTYDQFLQAYTADERRSRRLERMNELFRAMFIDRHPAYGLYRHWYDVLERSPEFPAPPTADPTPRIAEASAPDIDEIRTRYAEPRGPNPSRRMRRLVMIAVPIVVLLALGSAALLAALNQPGAAVVLTITATLLSAPDATPSEGVSVAVMANTDAPAEPTEAASPTAAVATRTRVPATPTPTTPAPTTPAPSPTPTTPAASPTSTATAAPSATDTPTVPSATSLPAEGVTGVVDVLSTVSQSQNANFDPEVFIPIEGGYRMGRGTAGQGEIIAVVMPASVMNSAFGNNAPARIRRMDVEMTLRTINPNLVNADDVFFGSYWQAEGGDERVGIRVEVVNQTVINLYRLVDEQATFLSQRSVNAVIVRLRMERSLENGSVSLYYNDELLGEPVPFLSPDAAVQPAVFVRDGG
jgi:serine/threonine protein kinase